MSREREVVNRTCGACHRRFEDGQHVRLTPVATVRVNPSNGDVTVDLNEIEWVATHRDGC